jgi:NitT/TauT family transport system substrate-binding protein
MRFQDRVKRLALTATLSASVFCSGAASAQTIELVEGSSPTISMADMVIASELFFKDEGLTATFNNATNGVVATQIVANGVGRVANITMEAYIRGYGQGMRGKFIATRGDRNNYYMAIPANSPIQKVEELKGKKIGVLSMGAQAIFYAKSMLKLAGIDPESDILVPVGFGDSAAAAIRSNQVQALVLTEPAYASLQSTGLTFRYLYHPTLKEAITAGYFTSDATIAQQRPMLVKFARSMIKTSIFVNENPQVAIQLFWKKFPQLRPPGTLEEAIKAGVAEMNFSPIPGDKKPITHFARPDRAMLANLLDTMNREGLISYKMDVNDLVNDDIFNEASQGIDVEAVKKLAREWKL